MLCSTTVKVVNNLQDSDFAWSVKRKYNAGNVEWHKALEKLKRHLFTQDEVNHIDDITRGQAIVQFLCHS